jgi:glycerol-3-phosphate cytidylyltransferase-like family protein
MAVGGDLGMSSNGDTMTSYLVKFNPDIIILGGDIAYDDGERSCYYSWDTIYSMF